MDRPRIAALISAAAASAVAFSVVSHWRLVGTLAGAALVPVICTLVSHWSSAGLDGAGRWARRRLDRGSHQKETAVTDGLTGPSVSRPDSGASTWAPDDASAADVRVVVPSVRVAAGR